MSGFGRILEDLNEAEVEYVLVGSRRSGRIARSTWRLHTATSTC
jgi:hypothetical protein